MKPTVNFLKIFVIAICCFLVSDLSAQQWRGGGGNFSRQNMKKGRFYGKVVDDKGKGVGYAAVQLFGMKFDTTTKSRVETLLAGQITEDNGDFSLEEIPIFGEFTLKISILGYKPVEQKVTFGLKGRPGGGKPGGGTPGQGRPGGGFPQVNTDKDLGNIVLATGAQDLEEVVVKGEAANVSLELDKKVFRVDKDATTAGGTAEDALRNIPSLSVDLDGNLTVRNAAPQLFIDGRPTNLTLDQIAADEIDYVEVITNPSAKYDASGGQGGIVNVVLKKDRRIGYNGSFRAGIDSQLGGNGGLNLNVREGKINGFISASLFRRVSIGDTETDRENLFENPRTNIFQNADNEFAGTFTSLRGGFDWFIDNRNTLTISGNTRGGSFDIDNDLLVDTDTLLGTSINSSQYTRVTDSEREFRNYGVSVLFKHLFPKERKEWTADISYNEFNSDNNSNFTTQFIDSGFSSLERQLGNSDSKFVTIQSDFVEPFANGIKLETGVRAAIRNFVSNNTNAVFNDEENAWVDLPNFADKYEFDDYVYAAYVTFSKEYKTWGYQAGLRAESSQYEGTLPEENLDFGNEYPLSLFPSVFVTKKINENDNLQFSYSRRINRPSFFNLIPFTDFSDSLNLRRGNPELLPEFTNSFEATYQNIFDKGDNLLITVYYKEATDLITSFQSTEFNPDLNREVVITSYENSNSSYAYGAEFTVRNTLAKWFTITSNLNLYNSRVDASNVESDLINEQFTWFLKENIQVRLPKSFSLQINGQFQGRRAFNPSSGGRFSWRGTSNTAQGYTKGFWFVDLALRKSIMKRKGSLTLSVNDVFRTRRTGSFSETEFFIQDSWRTRNQQLVRFNFSYRFGEPDVSLFKRKNNNVNNDGADLMN